MENFVQALTNVETAESLPLAAAEIFSVASRNIPTETSSFSEPTTASKLAAEMVDEGDLADLVNAEADHADVSETTGDSSTNISAETEISSVNKPTGHVSKRAPDGMANSNTWHDGFKIRVYRWSQLFLHQD